MENDSDAVLAINEAFYRSFSAGDFTAMKSLWSERDCIACIHPGWPPVRGHSKVMMAWEGILATPPEPGIHPLEATVEIEGDLAYVICFEAIGDSYLVATNLFVHETDGWKLLHHQAGLTEHVPKSAPEPIPPRVLH
ncbi:MAG: nuclear transport factor 2 family protein [Alphaproteobacteria bacterium]